MSRLCARLCSALSPSARLFAALFCVTALAASLCAQPAASVPPLVKFSGTISGAPSGTVGVIFALYKDSSGGAPLWQEVQSVTLDAAGHYTAFLGSRSAAGIPVELFATGEAHWLAVQPQGQPEQPRVLLVSVPYALKASDAETLGGLPASAFLRADAASTLNSYISPTAVNSAASRIATAAIVASGASAGYLPVFTDAGGDLSSSSFFQAANGYVGIGTTTPAFNLNVISQVDPAAITVEGYGIVGVNFIGRRARGTLASPLPLAVNDNLMAMQGRGYYSGPGGEGFSPGSRAYMKFFAAENWTDTAQGSYITLATTLKGTAPTTTPAPERVRITDAGWVGIGTTTPAAMLEVNGPAQFDGLVSFAMGQTFPGTAVTLTAADGSIAVGGTATAPNVEVAALGITDAKVHDVNVAKVTGAASILASNIFSFAQYINAGPTGTLGLSVQADSSAVTDALYVTTASNNYQSTAIYAAATNATPSATAITATSAGAAIRASSSLSSTIFANSYYNGSAVTAGVDSTIQASAGYAVYGEADSTTGATYGTQGLNYSSAGIGAGGIAVASSGSTFGVQGLTYSNGGTGVSGVANSGSGVTTGVEGDAASTNGTGVRGAAESFTGNTVGVVGVTRSPNGTALYGLASAESCSTIGGVYTCSVIPGGTAGYFQVGTGGTLLLGQTMNTSFNTSNVFRIDSNGKGFFDGGTQTGGADFAESVEVEGPSVSYAAGDLMTVDPARDRRFKLVSEPYSTLVAGIYATKPGILATPHTMDDPRIAAEIPLAMVGIVPCKVTAENGPIHRGDLLVSSSTPGYAMKGTDRNRMLGAVVGKALGSLETGSGTVEVLVTLQ